MQIKKVLSRKDAYSVLVAIVLGLLAQLPLTMIPNELTSKIMQSGDSGLEAFSGGTSAQDTYLRPIVVMLIGVVLVEVAIHVVVMVNSFFAPHSKRK